MKPRCFTVKESYKGLILACICCLLACKQNPQELLALFGLLLRKSFVVRTFQTGNDGLRRKLAMQEENCQLKKELAIVNNLQTPLIAESQRLHAKVEELQRQLAISEKERMKKIDLDKVAVCCASCEASIRLGSVTESAERNTFDRYSEFFGLSCVLCIHQVCCSRFACFLYFLKTCFIFMFFKDLQILQKERDDLLALVKSMTNDRVRKEGLDFEVLCINFRRIYCSIFIGWHRLCSKVF